MFVRIVFLASRFDECAAVHVVEHDLRADRHESPLEIFDAPVVDFDFGFCAAAQRIEFTHFFR